MTFCLLLDKQVEILNLQIQTRFALSLMIICEIRFDLTIYCIQE